MGEPGDLLFDYANAERSSGIGNVFPVRMVGCKEIPEGFDVSVGIVAGDVVEDDQATRADERRLHLPVLSEAVEAVVAVDEKKVDGAIGEEAFVCFERGRRVGIGAEQVELLAFAGKAAIDWDAKRRVAATEFAARKINADQLGVGFGKAGPQIERPAAMRADFEHGLRAQDFDVIEKLSELAAFLDGAEKGVAILKGFSNQVARAVGERGGAAIEVGEISVRLNVKKSARESHGCGSRR
jgi:hypothetical protein